MTRDIRTYIDNIKCTVKDSHIELITVEHRSNNPKRDYLFVNRLQAKHIPAIPSKMIDMCNDLASQLTELEKYNNILVIGFAETATGIAHFVAKKIKNCKYVINTTRENMEQYGKQLITFEEEHSHATTQRLFTWKENDLSSVDFVLFVEDEISTGNTILNFIKEFKRQSVANKNVEFGVASICNWQSKRNRNIFDEEDIKRFFLISGELKDVNAKMDLTDYNLVYTKNLGSKETPIDKIMVHTDYFKYSRLGRFPHAPIIPLEVFDMLDDISRCTVRVIGTEECMAPAIELGYWLEKYRQNDVVCHSTTRSRIDVIRKENEKVDNVINTRQSLCSTYDTERTTYIYNIYEHTDYTIIVTDKLNETFLYSIKNLLNTKHIIAILL